MPQEKLQGHLLRGAKGLVRARSHHQLAQLELAGAVELLDKELKTGFQDGEGVRARITLPRLAGTIIGGQQFLIARPRRFVFGCRHGEGEELGLGLTPVSVASPAEELDVVGDDLADAALFAFLVLEGAVLQPPLDVERIALLDVFRGRLGEAVPADDGVELGLFLAFDRSGWWPGGWLETAFPFWVCRSSASRVALPMRMTLLTPRILRS